MKKTKRKSVTTKERTIPPKKFFGVLFLILAILVFFSFLDYHQEQWNSTDPSEPNWVGQFGALVGYYGFHNFGAAIWIIPFLLGFLGYRFFSEQKRGLRVRQGLLGLVSLISLSALLSIVNELAGIEFVERSLVNQLTAGIGGFFGDILVFKAFKPVLGSLGCVLIFSVSFVSSLYIGLGDNLGALSHLGLQAISSLLNVIKSFVEKIFKLIWGTLQVMLEGLQSFGGTILKLFKQLEIPRPSASVNAVSYTHLTLPTKVEV